MLDVEWLKLIFGWLFDRKARLRLMGYRPEVICLVKGRGNGDKYLMVVPEGDRSVWMLPQEGIEVEETIADAAMRCLKVELGIDEAQLHFRRSTWIAKRVLPKDRWAERDLPYSLRGLFGGAHMIGKGYFAALIVADANATIRPNPAEIHKWEWVNAEELHRRIATNSQDKLDILRMTWRRLIGE